MTRECGIVLVSFAAQNQFGDVLALSPDSVGILIYHDLPGAHSYDRDPRHGELVAISHSSPRDHGLFIGIEFDEASRNSMLHFQPELLIREL